MDIDTDWHYVTATIQTIYLNQVKIGIYIIFYFSNNQALIHTPYPVHLKWYKRSEINIQKSLYVFTVSIRLVVNYKKKNVKAYFKSWVENDIM